MIKMIGITYWQSGTDKRKRNDRRKYHFLRELCGNREGSGFDYRWGHWKFSL